MTTTKMTSILLGIILVGIIIGEPCSVYCKPSESCKTYISMKKLVNAYVSGQMITAYVSGKITTRELVISTHLMLFEWVNLDDPMIPYEANRIENYYIRELHPKNIGLGVVHWIRDFYVAYVDRMGYDHTVVLPRGCIQTPNRGLKTIVDKYMHHRSDEIELVKSTHRFFFGWVNADDPVISYEADRIKTFYIPNFGRRASVVWIEDFYTAYSDRMGYGKIG